MSTYLQQALPRVVIHRTQVLKKKQMLLLRFSPTKENRVHQKISIKTDKDGFSPAIFKSRLNKKISLLNVQFFAFVFYFLQRNLWKEWLALFVPVVLNFISSYEARRRFPLISAIEFRSRGVIPLANQKLPFDERISCIVKRDDFSPRSHRAVSQQVTPFVRHCKGRGDRCRALQMENECVQIHLIQVHLKKGFQW